MHRRSTVHDLTSLALHPKGERARPTETNALLDARGNWIARDAGGWGGVPKRGTRNLGVDKGKQREVVEDDGEEEDEEEEEQGDMRSRKRRKRVHDYDFLAPALDASIPSSDLLKQIHHFAAGYYTTHDLLFDSSREYRRERKARKKARQTEEADEDGDGDGDGDDGEDTDGDENDGEEEDSAPSRSKSKGKTKEKKPKALRRDMYKAFDGSALMAIAILLQYHIASLVHPTLSDQEGWEAEMEAEESMDQKGIRRGKGKKRKVKVSNEIISNREVLDVSDVE